MAEMVKGEVNYDAQALAELAQMTFESLAGIPWSGFAVEGVVSDNTDALTVIWDNWEDFQQRSNT